MDQTAKNGSFVVSSTGNLGMYGQATPAGGKVGWWPIQAVLWLEWGISTAAHSFPSARWRFRAVHSDSISTAPSCKINSAGSPKIFY